MESEFNDTQLLIKKTLRDYLEREIEPLVADMEDGKLLCYEPIRQMMGDLGLGDEAGEFSALLAESSPEDHLGLFLPRILPIEIARVCGGLCLSWGASVGLAGGALDARGTKEQKERWGTPIRRFERIAAWCLTEPGAGSAAIRDMKTRALPDGDHYVLNGTKTFITNAPYADIFVIYAKLQHEGESESVQPFIVEREDPGVETGQPFKKMGFRSSPTGEVFLQDCRIPADRLVGGGVRDRDHVRSSLASERIGLQLISYGIMERAFDIAVEYSRDRHQGGQAIGTYQLIQRRLARMYTALHNARTIVYSDVHAGRRLPGSVADICVGKLYIGEMASWVTQEAIHILAGNGYMEEYVVERLARDAKLMELGGGTTEIQELTAGQWLFEHYGR
ncbi:MAG: acyl-CoA dehydrogenase family protein [Deltaproteobacteria bacterium]|nr:acyl-CoA dehydrogenase family protein [Deltaproteobacteria bacterium]MBW2696564.1 acyl-CoA dehydrogenase family protein [Deltaproteobacteria bacterium]